MAFGQFTTAEQVGPDLYRFGLADGTSTLFGGPPALDLAEKIRRATPPGAAQGPGALAAAPTTPAPTSVSDAPTVQQNAFSQAAAASQAPAAPSVETKPSGSKVARMPLAQARSMVDGNPENDPAPAPPTAPAAPGSPAQGGQPAAPGQQAQPQGDRPLGYTMEAYGPGGQKIIGPAVLRPDGSIGVYSPPTRGSPGGFTKLGRQTMEQHQEARQDSAEAEFRAQQAQAAGVQAEAENIAAQESAAEEAKWQAGVQANDQQEEIKAIETRVSDLRARHDKAREIAQAGKVDENQYMSGARGVLSAIGMALGAFGGVLGRSPNFAGEFVESQIQKNIRRQEGELQAKNTAKDNALGELNRELGSRDLAKNVYAQMLRERTAADREHAALSGKSEVMRNYNLAVAERLRAKIIEEDAKNEMLFREHVMGNNIYFQQGRAGSSGGFYQPTLQGVQNVKDLQKPDAGGAAGGATSPAAVEQLAGMGQAIVAANKISGMLEGDTSERDDPLAGPLDAARRFVSDDAQKSATELEQATTALAKGVQSAFGKSDRDAEDALNMASGGGSAAARARAATALRTRAVEQARQTLAGLPPAQQQAMLNAMPPEARAAILGQR